MLREGQPDGYILTCTQPVMSALCVWPGRLAECRHGSAEQRADRRVGREVLALASVPQFEWFEKGFAGRDIAWKRLSNEAG